MTNVIEMMGYQVELVNEIPMEDVETILKSYEGNFGSLRMIGSGSYGDVFGYEQYAIKRFQYESSMNRDIDVLKDISHLDFIPTLYAVIDDCVMIMERVEGKTVRDYCNYGMDDGNIANVDHSFIEMFEENLIEVIKNGYSPEDLHESNVMIDFKTNTLKMVDVGYFKKHYSDYDNFDIHSIKKNVGYSTANTWTGRALQRYIDKQQEKLQSEANDVLKKYIAV
jgi:tRNA A-37 threonylcarbamoyl transferase component Bud32